MNFLSKQLSIGLLALSSGVMLQGADLGPDLPANATAAQIVNAVTPDQFFAQVAQAEEARQGAETFGPDLPANATAVQIVNAMTPDQFFAQNGREQARQRNATATQPSAFNQFLARVMQARRNLENTWMQRRYTIATLGVLAVAAYKLYSWWKSR